MHATARVNNNNRNNTHLVRSWFARVTGHAHILTATGTRADADAIASSGGNLLNINVNVKYKPITYN